MTDSLIQNSNKIRKVLMLAYMFPPFQSVGYSIRVVKFIKYLPALGWLPVILTIDDQIEYETMRRVGSDSLLSEIQTHVKIYRTTAGEPTLKFLEKEKEFGKRNWLTAVLVKLFGGVRRWTRRNFFLPDWYIAWLPFALRQGRQIVMKEGIDVIFATCPPHSVALVGAVLKRLTGKPLILDFRDDWIGMPWYYSKPKIIRMVEGRLENWVVKTADKIILVTEWSQKMFHERYPSQWKDKFVMIPNGCDLVEFAMLKSINETPHNPKFTIIHVGTLNASKRYTRSPANFFHAIKQLLQKHPDLTNKLILLFAGDFPEEFRQLVEELGLSSVIMELGYLPHDQVLRLIKSADLLLTIATERFSSAIPGKIYEYWAVSGPPILLLSYPGAATELVDRYGLGFTVDPSNINGIELAIWTTYQKYQTTSPLRISTTGIESFDRQILTCQLAQVLSMVCAN
jgi:glycosyltransferase involved in cell wall biosynthesis